MARTEIMAEALSCPRNCKVLYGERVTLSMHIPAGSRYPLNLSVPLTGRSRLNAGAPWCELSSTAGHW